MPPRWVLVLLLVWLGIGVVSVLLLNLPWFHHHGTSP
jgi:hypothetical protein